MTSEELAGYAGIILSLLFSYIPGLKDWFGVLSGEMKRLVMLALLALIAGAVYAQGCYGFIALITCDGAGIKQLIGLFVVAMISNQVVYLVSPNGKTK